MSAVNGAAAPPTSSSNGSSAQATAAGAGDKSAVAPHRDMSSGGFRPIGVTQTIAFHAGRFAGTAASGNGRTNERESA